MSYSVRCVLAIKSLATDVKILDKLLRPHIFVCKTISYNYMKLLIFSRQAHCFGTSCRLEIAIRDFNSTSVGIQHL